jgi:hypothetical protein
MLSLTSGSPIAIIVDNDKKDSKKYIYYKDADKDDEPEIETTKEQKTSTLKKWLNRNEKLQKKDINDILDAYKNNDKLENKHNQKILEKGMDYVEKSLKRYLHFDKDTELFPYITDKSFRILVSGTSGSGKTWFINELVKVNKPRGRGGIFIFSPFDEDPSLKIKNLIKINLENYDNDYDKNFELEDIPDGSICIFDDIDTYKKQYRDLYIEVRDTLMERGRHPAQGGHYGISCINITHNPLQGVKSKITLRESMYYVCFPRYNARDAKVLLTNYTSITKDGIDEIMNTNSRWVFVRKSVPSHWIGQHEIGLL